MNKLDSTILAWSKNAQAARNFANDPTNISKYGEMVVLLEHGSEATTTTQQHIWVVRKKPHEPDYYEVNRMRGLKL